MKLNILNVFDARTAELEHGSEDAAMNVLLLEDKAVLDRSDFASWKDFYSAASKMAKSLGAELVERNHMTTPPYHLDAMIECMKDLGHVSADTSEPLKLAVHLEGGLMKCVLANDPRARNVELYVFDYDVEGADDEEISEITCLFDNSKDEACIKKITPEFDAGIDLNDVFGFQG